MNNKPPLPLKIRILRWIARIWSLSIFIFAVVMAFSPDPYATGEPISTEAYVVLGLWGLSAVGLLIAWLWERLGALVAIIALVLREVLYFMFYGSWILNFLLIWLAFIPPAVMYLLAWHMEQKFHSS